MKKVSLAMFFIFMSHVVFAWESSTRKTTCYTFLNHRLLNKSSCVLNGGGGVGGITTRLTVGKKQYLFETDTTNEDLPTFYYPNGNININPIDVIEYTRNPKTLKVLKENQDTDVLFCYKTKDGKTDICHK
ncbi:MAG: hypothetical protein Q3971_08145 [Moraxella sp.]|nr:hypothetical protein [Moraxella sp.]